MTRAHCVESLSKTLNQHCFSPPRWKKKWLPANYHTGKVKQTRLCRRSSVPPQQQNYIVESGLNTKEIEMGTTAKSLELRFRLYLYLTHLTVSIYLSNRNKVKYLYLVMPLQVVIKPLGHDYCRTSFHGASLSWQFHLNVFPNMITI